MKEKIVNFYEKHQKGMVMFFSFMIPFLLCFFVCIGKKVYPFGDRCILHVDMYHQYCPFFTELMDKLKSGGNLMFSWTAGLGSDFIALYAYYLASPLNWLLIICPRSLVIEFMTFLVLVKIGVSGIGFYQFIQYKSGARFGETRILTGLVFSTAYAMSGFVAAYYWDIMWMDCVALMPFTAMGLLMMIREKKPVLYFISLSLAIISNYYLAIMICIFLVLYFVIVEIEEKGGIQGFIRFAVYSLLAGGTAAFLLIPEYKILSFSGSSGIEHPDFKWYFGIIDELARATVTAEPYTGAEHWPNLYSGAFTLLLIVMYAVNKKIAWKQKLPRFILVFFFLISFSNSWLDFLWHGLHFPDSLPGRQSFLFAFVLLAMAFEVTQNWEGVELWHPAAGIAVWLVLLAAEYYVVDKEVAEPMAIVITGIFIVCYALLAVMLHISKEKDRGSFTKLACFLALGELILNMGITGFSTTSRTLYVENQESYEKLLEKKKQLDGDNFWRVEDTQRKTKSDSGLYDYKSATQFSSLMNINVSHFYQRMYMEGGKNFYCYNGATPLLSAMLAVKYQISDNAMEGGPLSQVVAEADGKYLYENKYTMPLGFVIPTSIQEAWDVSRDKITNVNDLSIRLGATGETLTKIETAQAQEAGSTSITASQEGYYYAACENNTSDSLKISNSNGYTTSYSKTTHTYLFALGYLKEGDTATVTNYNSEVIPFTTYVLNLEPVEAAYKTLSAQPMENIKYTDTSVEGTVNVTTPGSLFLSIPNEGGWTLYVDDQKMEIQDFAETFISTPIRKGQHKIRLTYFTPGLGAGGAISLISVALFVAACLLRRWQRKKEKQGENNEFDGKIRTPGKRD